MDDFARSGLRGWDRDRFVSQVLEPLLAGRPARYQRWDLVTDTGLEWVEVPAGVPVVVEGVSATDDRVPVPWDVTLWLDTPADVRRQRILSATPPPRCSSAGAPTGCPASRRTRPPSDPGCART